MATALLKVIYNRPEGTEPKKNFAVCVKGLDMPDDLSLRLAEWIELVIAMGADKIFLYTYEVHPKVAELLEVFASEGKIDLRPITLPGPQPNLVLPFTPHNPTPIITLSFGPSLSCPSHRSLVIFSPSDTHANRPV